MKNKETNQEKNERPVLILILAISFVALGLVFEAFQNNARSKKDFQNHKLVPELQKIK